MFCSLPIVADMFDIRLFKEIKSVMLRFPRGFDCDLLLNRSMPEAGVANENCEVTRFLTYEWMSCIGLLGNLPNRLRGLARCFYSLSLIILL